MKYIVFNNKKVDTALFIQLQDLANVLSGVKELKFKFDYGSYVDLEGQVISASHFWDTLPPLEMEAGYKTDIYLRAIGTLRHTDTAQVQAYGEFLKPSSLKKFGIELFTLFEDLRLQEICKRERPGTSRLFSIRNQEYHKYFENQLIVNQSRGYLLDHLFCMVYLTLHASGPDRSFSDVEDSQRIHFEALRPMLYEVFDASSTRDNVRIAEQMIHYVAPHYSKDVLNEYFILPVLHLHSKAEEGLTFDELKRSSSLKNEDQDENRHDLEEAKKEKLPTWHGETKDQEQSRAFLQFDLESGTQTQMLGGTARATEDGDEALGSVQGKSGASKQRDYSEAEETKEQLLAMPGGAGAFGTENKHAVSIRKNAEKPSALDEQRYKELLLEVDLYIKDLSKTIQKTLEHRREDPQQGLPFGRLSKNLLPLVLEDFPKVFYKKKNESKDIDAAFMLLVDCSASMHNKMEETKKGIILFHEVLKSLRIPHAIVGFWEDANGVKDGYQPNYFHWIKDFHYSITARSGAEIMQLEPQEDNRDGFSIRVALQELKKRKEKNHFLLVFSDGEPAAAQYDQNGIVDTKEAVMQARKQGVEVIGMFLSNGEIFEEDEKTMQNIYDREHVMVPSVKELPEHFAPLLKKLLLKSM
ncbi:VWA domain-containing protein [Ammoniphilus sp. YIM 78166]|uniref:vWA domain-containing protein n=1 Tax=Ammoniphilus sp. YIM 78166 TaxID=1644106 RepID=UPI001F0D1475|nr:VWA domain-containing protein [Ammoniphilus sp. YIM 78166]